MPILPGFVLYRGLCLGSATSDESTPDLAYELLSRNIYLREGSTEMAKMERKYSLPGFYRKNWRKNTRTEEAMLRLLVGHIGAEELTVGFSGSDAYFWGAVVRLLLRFLRGRRVAIRCGGAVSSLGACSVRGEESERERREMAL